VVSYRLLNISQGLTCSRQGLKSLCPFRSVWTINFLQKGYQSSDGPGLNSKASMKPCSARGSTGKWTNVDLAKSVGLVSNPGEAPVSGSSRTSLCQVQSRHLKISVGMEGQA